MRFLFRFKKITTNLEFALNNNKWKLKIIPFFLLIVITVNSQLSRKAELILYINLLLILIFIPLSYLLVPIKSLLIKLHHIQIVPQSTDLSDSDANNIWSAVKELHLVPMVKRFWKHDVPYVGWVIVPQLNMYVPLADFTNNDVYLYGAGMLQPQFIDSDEHITIGAHNLGSGSQALFSPLANKQLYLIGMKVCLVSLDKVREFTIQKVQIIDDTDVDTAMSGLPQSITLMTCTDDGNRRFLVHATQNNEYATVNASQEFKQQLLELK